MTNFINHQKPTIMQQMLATSDSYIENLRPEQYTDLQSPLSAEEIRALEQKYDIAIPKDLKALHRWKNEQINTNYEAFVNNSTFFLLEEALDSLKVLLSGFKHN